MNLQPTAFQKPENALKRADELQLIGLPDAALKVLHQAILHKRFKSSGWESIQEQIILRHVQLCVDLEKLKLVREALHQYRAVSQQTNVGSLGKVIGEFREKAEKKLKEAKAKVQDDKKVAMVDDLEVGESPEALMLSTLQLDVRDTSSRKLQAALRFVWESYKMMLDVIKSTPKLEKVYHETAQKAFTFCKENERCSEFKRLCEVLRNHYIFLHRSRHKIDPEVALRPEIHLETRLVQLSVAGELGLWREACATAEDIYSLGLHELFYKAFRSNTEAFHRAREKLLKWLATYYDELGKLLWVSDNCLFHALARIRYFLHIKQFKKVVSSADMEQLATRVVLSVVAIPAENNRIKGGGGVEELGTNEVGVMSIDNKKKLAAILGQPSIPTRDFLKLILSSKDIVACASPAAQEIYNLIEDDFTPLKLCSQALPLLNSLTDTEYVSALKRVVFHKMITQLSTVYNSMSIDYFTTDICTEDFLPWVEAEKLVVSLVEQGQVQIRLDYAQRALYFGSACTDATVAMRHNLSNLAKQLAQGVQAFKRGQLGVEAAAADKEERERFLETFNKQIEIEHLRVKRRNVENEHRRQEKQAEQVKAEEERKRHLELQKQQDDKLEAQRREDAQKRREEKRLSEEKSREKSETAELMLAEIKKLTNTKLVTIKGRHIDDINVDDFLEGNVAYEDIERAQDEQRNRERIERIKQRRLEAKRTDHFVRACREEEEEALNNWKEQILNGDTGSLLQLQSKVEQEHRATFEEGLVEKQRFEYAVDFKTDWIAEKMITRAEEYEEGKKEQTERLAIRYRVEKIERAQERKLHEIAEQQEQAMLKEQQENERRALAEIAAQDD
eukprot:GHVS01073300.1.p1 GENE.GHVS01073300.1~~GHVS01073300.1.p1  ORF type:complete len:847 (-),score=149.92 GHVS01073300.1:83-2623(-)